jgi:phosphatidylglycerophosphate synthase
MTPELVRPPADAVLLCEPDSGGLRVAGITLLDRLLMAAHRAGCREIVVVSRGPLPAVSRAKAWRVPFRVAAEAPQISGGLVVVASTSQCLDPADLRLILSKPGRLVANGRRLPAGTFDGSRSAGVVVPDFDALPEVAAQGASRAVARREDLAGAEEALWRSLKGAADGLVDRLFNRPVGRILSRRLVWTPATPNGVSVASIVIGVAGGWLLGQGTDLSALWGAIVFQLSAIVDCVDGDLARAKFQESALGKWLDLAGDQVVHAAVFIGIAVGLARAGSSAPVLWLGLSAVAGGLLAFAAVLRGLARGGSGDLWLRRLIDATANRDFSVLVLALAIAGRLEWFLWLAAIGTHVFWVAVLGLQWRERSLERCAS